MSAKHDVTNRLRHSAIAAMLLAFTTGPAHAASVLLPFGDQADQRAPAVDLLDPRTGDVLDRDEAFNRLAAGEDLSALNPRASDTWSPTPLSFNDSDKTPFPADGGRVDFESDLIGMEEVFQAGVTDPAGRRFRLSVSLNSHAALLRAALLRRLGYAIPSPRHYRALTIRFASKEAIEKFLLRIDDKTGAPKRRWLKLRDDSRLEVTLQDVLLERARLDVYSFHWGWLSGSELQGRRMIRALVVPFVLLDVPESINMYSWQAGEHLAGNVLLTYRHGEAFQETAFEDGRWIMNRIARLPQEDLRRIVEEGRYPKDIAEVLLQKLTSRRNNLVELFKLKKDLPSRLRKLPVDLKLDAAPGVKDGKVVQEFYDGWAMRFTYLDPQSPLRKEEIGRYLRLELLGEAIQALTKQVNDNIQLRTPTDVATEHQGDLMKELLDHIKKHPDQPLSKPVGAWAGPTVGLNVYASRNLVTGTYYGSDSKIQLVDNISAQASMGFFMGFDGVPTVIPSVAGNVYYQRNYIHVRPVASMEEAIKNKLKNIWIPGFMKSLGRVLEPEPKCKLPDSRPDPSTEGGGMVTTVPECPKGVPAADLPDKQVGENLDAFLREMREGEVFTITDSIGVAGGGAATIPLSSLLTADPLGITGSFTFGGSARGVVMRRTTFTRTKQGLQVYFQTIQNGALDFTFDFNFWMRILRAGSTHRLAVAESDAYILGDKPAEPLEQRKMLIALRSLLKRNNSELLEEHFSPYKIRHRLPSDGQRLKLLRWQWSALEEAHRMEITPPAVPAGIPDAAKPTYKASDHKRTFYRHRLIRRSGTNDFSLISDIVEGAAPGYGFDDGAGGDNPSNSFMGKAKWTIVGTEGETTPGTAKVPVTTVERHWAGWRLSKKNLFKIFDEIEERVAGIAKDVPLFNRDRFNDVARLEMYEIQSSLLIYETGIRKITDEFKARRAKSEHALFLLLVELEGRASFERWCRSELARKGTNEASPQPWVVEQQLRDILSDRAWFYDCTPAWMNRVFSLLRDLPRTQEQRIRWSNQLVNALEKGPRLDTFLNWLGKEHYFFQVRLSAFRKGDEDGDGLGTALDGIDHSVYTSGGLGTINPEQGLGPISELANQTGIMTYELYGRYISEAQ